jgi:sugar/nucleoside kinase (ribokinase family)
VQDTRFDIIAIGNAIVDIIASIDDDFLDSEDLVKGSMRLIDAAEAEALYARMPPGRETSGGSAANTVAGLAALGLRTAFIGQVAADQLGDVFRHDINAIGVQYDTPSLSDGEPTARSMILVTPDAHRTMNTFLGVSQFLPASALDARQIEESAILYLEGYLWDPEQPRAAMEKAIAIARAAGRQIAFTLSDSFCVDRHRDGFNTLIDEGKIDILFANEHEILSLTGAADIDGSLDAIAGKVPVVVVTRSEEGAVAVENGQRAVVKAEPVAKVIDTTGAGDQFAAGFLAGRIGGRPLEECLHMGAIAAAEVIAHYGPRPETDVGALIAARLG